MAHLRVLVSEAAESEAVDAIFEETTTLGLRRSSVERYILAREAATLDGGGRPVRVKLAQRPTGRTAKVEADDLANVAGAGARNAVRRRAETQFDDGET